jgi:hypothetical protein
MTTRGISQSAADNRADHGASARPGLLHCNLLVATHLAWHGDLLHYRGSRNDARDIYGKCRACGKGAACGQKSDKSFFHSEIPFKGRSSGITISL